MKIKSPYIADDLCLLLLGAIIESDAWSEHCDLLTRRIGLAPRGYAEVALRLVVMAAAV